MSGLDNCAIKAAQGELAAAAYHSGASFALKHFFEGIGNRRERLDPPSQDSTFVDRATRPSTITRIKEADRG